MSWDVIVIGVGGMGAATCLELSRRGARVLGLEQHAIGHDLGSSHGETRLIRKAYFEAPDYVPLVAKAYEGWRLLERECERQLLVTTGLVLFGPPDGSVIPGAERAAREHGLAFERLGIEKAAERFPGFAAASHHVALVEPEAGFLRVDECVRAAALVARHRGVEIREGGRVQHIRADGDGVRVDTQAEALFARRAIVTTGAWSSGLVETIAPFLTVRRKLQLWLEVEPGAYRFSEGCPAYAFETNDGFFYGFPALEPGVVKVALHTGGEAVKNPSTLDRNLRTTDSDPILAFARDHLLRTTGRVLRHRACMYTMTPDEHFVIDRHPDDDHVILGCGFSGHGFKFAPVVGAALADLALDGASDLPLSLFSASRFARS